MRNLLIALFLFPCLAFGQTVRFSISGSLPLVSYTDSEGHTLSEYLTLAPEYASIAINRRVTVRGSRISLDKLAGQVSQSCRDKSSKTTLKFECKTVAYIVSMDGNSYEQRVNEIFTRNMKSKKSTYSANAIDFYQNGFMASRIYLGNVNVK